MKRMADKVVVVTGAAQGIGRAVSELLAEEGASVIATDVQGIPTAADAGIAAVERLDVADENDWRRVIDGVVRDFGTIDVLVNNAGIATLEAIADLDLATWNRVIGVTQTGTFLGMREVIPVMQRGGGGSIVNLSSIWGNSAVPGVASYHAAKGAVRNLTKNAAVTYAPDSIRVNSVHPGFVDTPGTREQGPDTAQAVIDFTPLGRAADPREIAYGCLFLASSESSFVTGSELIIDGGYLAR